VSSTTSTTTQNATGVISAYTPGSDYILSVRNRCGTGEMHYQRHNVVDQKARPSVSRPSSRHASDLHLHVKDSDRMVVSKVAGQALSAYFERNRDRLLWLSLRHAVR
jgi:hypothetical protein